MSKKVISLVFVNNTTSIQPLQISNVPNVFSGINANTQYRWDITTQNLSSLLSAQIIYSYNGNSTTLTAPITDNSVTGIISALNSLNAGRFWSTTSGGNTYINTYNDFVTYTDLTINNSYLPTTTYWQFNFNVPVVTPYSFHIQKIIPPVPVFVLNFPNQQTGSTPQTGSWVAGATYTWEGQFSEVHFSTCTLYRNGIQIQQNSFAGANFSNVTALVPSLADTHLIVIDVNS